MFAHSVQWVHITDKAMLLLRSYLNVIRQRVEVDGILSREFVMYSGVYPKAPG